MEGTSSMVVNEEDDVIMVLPPGFRFHPTDEEIITHYLTKKVMDDRFTAIAIGQVDMNKCEPWDLPKKAKMKEKEWFFFCQRDRKYPTGMRTNRATGTGYWKATGKDREIYNNNNKKGSNNKSCLVGMKKTLVFYKGRAPKGEKTNWVMHEYRLEGRIPYYRGAKDEWVVCKIFQKNRGIIKRNLFAHELSRNDSYNMDEILGSPSPLPPLMDDIPSSSNHDHNNKPTIISSFTNDEHDFKDDVLQIQEHDQNSFFNIPTYPIINDFKSSYLNPINQENPSFYLNLYQECPNSSANHNSMISPSQDTAEISSSVISSRDNAPGITSNMDFEDLEGISVNHNMTDLESLWDY